MANSPLSLNHSTGAGYKPSFLAPLLSLCIVYLVLTTPILPLTDVPYYHFPLANPTLRNLAFFSAMLTNCLAVAHLKLRMSKPIVPATDERFSLVTLSAACVTLILGLLFVMKVTIIDPLAVLIVGGGRGGGGGGEGYIEVAANLFMQNRKFGR